MTHRLVPLRGILTIAVVTLVATAAAACRGQPGPSASATETTASTGISTPGAPATPTEPAGADAEAQAFARERDISVVEAQRRLGWQVLAPDLAQRLEGRSDFGGVWIDVDRGDRVTVGLAGQVTPEATAQVAAAATAIGLTEGYTVVGVRHPLRALDEASDWLGAELARANAGARATLLAGQRIDRNVVELQSPIGGELTSTQRELLTRARERLGDRLVVTTYTGSVTNEACTYPYCDPPLRAGIGIANGGRFCTGAFVAQSKTDSKLYQFTAGHCVWQATSTWSTKSATKVDYAIGPVWNTMWYPFTLTGDTFGDAAILQITNAAANPTPWVYFAFGPFQNPTYHISSDNYSVVGMFICVSGASYGISNCGRVTQLNVTATADNVTVHHLGRASYCGKGGDSGAPVYAYHVAYGIHVSALGSCDKLYQGIRAAENALNVNVLHTS